MAIYKVEKYLGLPAVTGYVLTSTTAGVRSWVAPSTGGVTSVSGTTNRITSSGGVTPIIDISASYVGQSSITTVGTLSSGIIPASLVTAGTFGTGAYVMDTSLTLPLLIGGTGATSKLTYKSTTGTGTTTAIAHQWLGGTNGATVIATMLNNGNVGIGITNPVSPLEVSGDASSPLLSLNGTGGGQRWDIYSYIDGGLYFNNQNIGTAFIIRTDGSLSIKGDLIVPSPHDLEVTGNNSAIDYIHSGINYFGGITNFRNISAGANGLQIDATNFPGMVSRYQGVATTGWGVPAIYESDRATGQTAAKNLVAYTVGAADGSFQISANVNVTTSTIHNFTVACTYTDETNTSRVLMLSFSQLAGTFVTAITNATGAGIYAGIPLHIRAKAGTTITIGTTGTFTTVTYNVEENITQIS